VHTSELEFGENPEPESCFADGRLHFSPQRVRPRLARGSSGGKSNGNEQDPSSCDSEGSVCLAKGTRERRQRTPNCVWVTLLF
jgi:hypothetical protein